MTSAAGLHDILSSLTLEIIRVPCTTRSIGGGVLLWIMPGPGWGHSMVRGASQELASKTTEDVHGKDNPGNQ
jgi:hypothetical protein